MKKAIFLIIFIMVFCGLLYADDFVQFPLSVLSDYSSYINKTGTTETKFLYQHGYFVGLIIYSKKDSSKVLILKAEPIQSLWTTFFVSKAEEKDLSTFDESWGTSRAVYMLEPSYQETYYSIRKR